MWGYEGCNLGLCVRGGLITRHTSLRPAFAELRSRCMGQSTHEYREVPQNVEGSWKIHRSLGRGMRKREGDICLLPWL